MILSENIEIAIIGMSARLPGAKNYQEFWQNLIDGHESVKTFSKEELKQSGCISESILNHPDFVPAKGFLDDAEKFAATFFKIPERVANIMDPQFRMLIECVWEAFEDAGYNLKNHSKEIVGVYTTSSTLNNYYEKNLTNNQKYMANDEIDNYEILIRNARDFLAPTLAYQFDFKGPCLNIQTACSSSLVAISQACDDLKLGKCDIAVAGGASITFPLKNGYLFKEGMIYAKNGHCSPFSTTASGTVPGDGGGIVLLKRVDSLKSTDNVHAIIKGYAVNNDGKNKLGFTAPGIDGQVRLLHQAVNAARICFDQINYIEAHGTGTKLGDQVEIESISQVMKQNINKNNKCLIGSVKSNIGHLDVASGIAGLIKSVLILKYKKIPKTINCDFVNTDLNLNNGKIQIVQENIDWAMNNSSPFIVGVSSFGVGGTNAHIILQEFSKVDTLKSAIDTNIILPLSAMNVEELEQKCNDLKKYLCDNRDLNITDIAYTLQLGREHFRSRKAIICSTPQSALNEFSTPSSSIKYDMTQNTPELISFFSARATTSLKTVQYLYNYSLFFKNIFDTCFNIIKQLSCIDLIQFILKDNFNSSLSNHMLELELSTFIEQYALACYWESIGVLPNALMGYGVGEYSAACFADILSLDNAIKLIVHSYATSGLKSSNYQNATVLAQEDIVRKLCHDSTVEIVFIETKNRVIVGGNSDDLNNFLYKLETIGIKFQQQEKVVLKSFDAALESVIDTSSQLSTKPGKYLIIKGKRNRSIHNYEINNNDLKTCDNSVNIHIPLLEVLSSDYNIALEIGSHNQLSSLLQQINNQMTPKQLIIVSNSTQSNKENSFLTKFAQLWCAGINIDWINYRALQNTNGQSISLPTYPFIKKSYLIHPDIRTHIDSLDHEYITTSLQPPKSNVLNYLYYPKWVKHDALQFLKQLPKKIIVLNNHNEFSQGLLQYLKENEPTIEFIIFQSALKQQPEMAINETWVNNRVDAWVNLISSLQNESEIRILYTESCVNNTSDESISINSFYDLVSLGKAVGKITHNIKIQVNIFSTNSLKCTSTDKINPMKAILVAPVLCLPIEYKAISARYIDLEFTDSWYEIYNCILKELRVAEPKALVALRSQIRYTQTFAKLDEDHTINPMGEIQLKQAGTYLITGGLGGIGLTIANYLAKTYKAKLILISRSKFPDYNEWPQYLSSNTTSNIAKKIRKLNNIKKNSSGLLIFSADVSVYDDMKQILIEAENKLGEVNGIIHAAAVFPQGLLQEKRVSSIKNMFNSKIGGLHVLDKLFADKPLDFMVLFSSLSAIRGDIGAIDYIAANLYLDAYAENKKNNVKYPVVSIGWDAWSEVGMRANYFNTRNNTLEIFPVLNNSDWEMFILEHKIDNIMLIPGSLLIQLSVSILQKIQNINFPCVFRRFSFLAPGFVNNISQLKCRAVLNTSESELSIEILQDTYHWKMLSRTEISNQVDSHINKEQLLQLISTSANEISIDTCLYNKRITTGEHWKLIKWIKQVQPFYIAKLELPDKFSDEILKFNLHPALLDVGISFVTLLLETQYLPFYIGSIHIYEALPRQIYSIIKINHSEIPGICQCDITFCNNSGNILLVIKNLILKTAANLSIGEQC